MNEPIFNSVHHLHRPQTIAKRQQWLTPGVSNCMVFNFNVTICHMANSTILNSHIVLVILSEPYLHKRIKVKF